MQYSHSELGELAVLYKFAKMGQCVFSTFGNEFDEVEHALDNCLLEFISTFIPEYAGQKAQHASLLARKL
jgi:hypothetical protein